MVVVRAGRFHFFLSAGTRQSGIASTRGIAGRQKQILPKIRETTVVHVI